MHRYEVIVGNIGSVYSGTGWHEAKKTYGEYKRQSETGYGRAGGEDVILMKDDEPHWEFIGELSQANEDDDEDTSEACGKCGEVLDNDCFGNPRCPQCDPPCPGCDDGPGPG